LSTTAALSPGASIRPAARGKSWTLVTLARSIPTTTSWARASGGASTLRGRGATRCTPGLADATCGTAMIRSTTSARNGWLKALVTVRSTRPAAERRLWLNASTIAGRMPLRPKVSMTPKTTASVVRSERLPRPRR